MHPLYLLTPMTGREAAEQRTVVIGTVELNWRLWLILIAASPVALLSTALAWTVVGQYALVVLPIVLIAASVLFYQRSTKGLRLRHYQVLMDKKRARSTSQFYLCGVPIDTSDAQYIRVLDSTVPYGREAAQRERVVNVDTLTPPVAAPKKRGRKKATAPAPTLAAEIPTGPRGPGYYSEGGFTAPSATDAIDDIFGPAATRTDSVL